MLRHCARYIPHLHILNTQRIMATLTSISSEDVQLSEQLAKVHLQGQDKTQLNDGQVLVSKGSGKTKVRKGQTEEEYQEQKKQFESEGPVLNTLTWLEEVDLSTLDKTKKSDRLKLENLAQRLYFKRQYKECKHVVDLGLTLFADIQRKRIQTEWFELEYLRDQCQKRLDQSSV